MIELLIPILIYIVSVFWARKETIKFYRDDVSPMKPGIGEIFFVFTPFLNTVYAAVYFVVRSSWSKPAFLQKFIDKLFGFSSSK